MLKSGNKKAPASADAFLEELAGTAPASAGLSWLVVYRLSPFWVLKQRVSKRTNNPLPQPESLSVSPGRVTRASGRYGVPLHYPASCAARLKGYLSGCADGNQLLRKENSRSYLFDAAGESLRAISEFCNY